MIGSKNLLLIYFIPEFYLFLVNDPILLPFRPELFLLLFLYGIEYSLSNAYIEDSVTI
jgi:hypothetical protein